VIEALHPERFRKTVGRLHTLRITVLINAMTKLDSVLRQAFVDRSLMDRLKMARYDMLDEEPKAVAPSIARVMSVINTVSVALDIITQALAVLDKKRQKRPATLGALVEWLIDRDCENASSLVEALLPDNDEYFVVTHGPDGRVAPQLPVLDVWVFVWRITHTNSYLTLRIAPQ